MAVVESLYYMPRLGTTNICSICFSADNMVDRDTVIENYVTNGRPPLPISQDSYDLKVTLPTSGGWLSFYENKKQLEGKRRSQLGEAVSQGKITGRKKK